MLTWRSGIQPKQSAQQKDGMIIMQKAFFFPFFYCTDKNYVYTTKKESPSPYPSRTTYVLQQIKSEGSQFKPQYMLSWAQGYKLVTRLTVTGSKSLKYSDYHGTAKQQLKKTIRMYTYSGTTAATKKNKLCMQDIFQLLIYCMQ